MVPLLPEVAFATNAEPDANAATAEPEANATNAEPETLSVETPASLDNPREATSVLAEYSFQLTVRVSAGGMAFILPTSSCLNDLGTPKPYDWRITWGDGSTQYAAGVSSTNGGIPHVYTVPGDYAITITPNSSAEAWLAAFGFNIDGYDVGANSTVNKSMVTGVLSPLTPEMTRNAAQINGTAAEPTYEWAYIFFSCINLTQAPVFQGWDRIESVGPYFACNMFDGCKNLTTLPAGFNLPQALTEVGNGFVSGMFVGCFSLTALPAGFNFPQGITSVEDDFARMFLYDCTSLTVLPAGFNLPQGITSAGDYFVCEMFCNCTSLTILPASFNFPQNMTSVGDYFAAALFTNCTSLTSLPTGFNLPQQITTTGKGFAYYLFYVAGGATFQINSEFTFSAGVPANTETAYFLAFQLSEFAPTQNRTATSIIGNCPTPESPRQTFDIHFSDINYIPINWGGAGQTQPGAGAPGSGDLWGTGTVTMDVALVIARVVTGGGMQLAPDQFAAVDMDFDGYITMADVILIMRKAIGI
jgi:hypothetical protein